MVRENELKKLIEKTWDIGKVTEIHQFANGVTNLNFKVVCSKENRITRYALKRYEVRVEEHTIQYEHAFMKHIQPYSNRMTTVPVTTRGGDTYIRYYEEGYGYYLALFTYLEGEDTYTWLYNDVSDETMISCAQTLACFHVWGYDFDSGNELEKQQLNVLNRFSDIRMELTEWLSVLEAEGNHPYFVGYYRKHKKFIVSQLEYLEYNLKRMKDYLPECTIHQDINPGNMKFDEKGSVCAILDLDWVVRGKRLYDVAWMAQQMLSRWDEDRLGQIPMDKLALYLRSYNETIQNLSCQLGSLTEEECDFLADMMAVTELTVMRDFVDLVMCDRNKQDILYYFYIMKYRNILTNTVKHSNLIRSIARRESGYKI